MTRRYVSGLIEYEGDEYEYDAIIYAGDDAHSYPDEVINISMNGNCLHVYECDDIIDLILDDANKNK
jgi:hypothetical protein